MLDQGCVVVSVGGQTVALFADDGVVRAVDNRCPHMGFPLHRGSVCDGILTCHWHHARFDLASGGTLRPVGRRRPCLPGRDPRRRGVRGRRPAARRARPPAAAPARRARAQHLAGHRQVGDRPRPREDTDAVFEAGLEFGVRASADGWGQGLTILTALRNLLPLLEPDERAHALHHGLAAVASDCDGMPPRHPWPRCPPRAATPTPSSAGFAAASRSATRTAPSARSPPRCGAARRPAGSPRCCTPPRPTTAI